MGQRGMQGLHRGRASGDGRGGEVGQGRLGGVETLDKGTLSGAHVSHRATEFGALILQIAHGPEKASLTLRRRRAGGRERWEVRAVRLSDVLVGR